MHVLKIPFDDRFTLPRFGQKEGAPSLQFWLLAAFLVLVFLTGGGSRTDISSLAILRPASVIACAIACLTVRKAHFVQHGTLIIGFGAIVLLAILHVIPLPPIFWQSLSGRNEIVEIDKLVAINDAWRPLTLAPMNGWHAIASLCAPLATLLFGIQLSREDTYRLLPLIIGLASFSGFLGLLQVIGSVDGPLYFYRITNFGAAVGLFANRNHAATLLACLFPMLTVLAVTAQGSADAQYRRRITAAVIGVVLVPLVLVTGSRAGLMNSVIAMAASALIYATAKPQPGGRKAAFKKNGLLISLLVIGGVTGLGMLTFFLSRATAVERLISKSFAEEGRTGFWQVSLELFWKYFPWGSGSGSFVEAYLLAEPDAMLDSTYLNRAHNDWVEIAVTFGLAGVIALALALVAYCWRTFKLWRQSNNRARATVFGRMAGIAIGIIGIASIFDYPLRTPTLMCVFTVLALWFTMSPTQVTSSSMINRGRGGGVL
ncbi:MAG TPA: O-antigen ligase family protein [Sphingorhabdus sp.]|uniref:O-antigen ligase family protein n=1 Tax=Sphingorhabdus sp. TaxID=1902408 RepID=UPI002CBC64DB|nr:O-antigen ligase family protein [Sphingorhabdus sp.]HMT42385.1 O-antigen ligase family protein [Sphingorhabdus sp.]HMU20712.1 O-antigen ligase family protein [Sphingorhabdus sp.]